MTVIKTHITVTTKLNLHQIQSQRASKYVARINVEPDIQYL